MYMAFFVSLSLNKKDEPHYVSFIILLISDEFGYGHTVILRVEQKYWCNNTLLMFTIYIYDKKIEKHECLFTYLDFCYLKCILIAITVFYQGYLFSIV